MASKASGASRAFSYAGLVVLVFTLMVSGYGPVKANGAQLYQSPLKNQINGKYQDAVSYGLPVFKSQVRNSKSKKDSLTFNTHSFKFGSLKQSTIHTVTDARFGQVYNGSVKEGEDYIYVFTGEVNSSTVVRVHVSSTNASSDAPLLFVVRQRKGVISWSVPLFLETRFSYRKVGRTLCPTDLTNDTGRKIENIVMDVTSASVYSTPFVLTAFLVRQFNLHMYERKTVSITPSEPSYFRYTFPPGVGSVVVMADSADDLCMTFSVQELQCPVFDLERNVEFTGIYQTMTFKGAITVKRSFFPEKGFFVVLVVKPHDSDCSGSDVKRPASFERKKTVTVNIKPSISEDQYLGAILGAIAWFFVFYMLALAIHIIYFLLGPHPVPPDSEIINTLDIEETEPMLGNGESLPDRCRGRGLESHPEGTADGVTYGSITETNDELFSRNSNGIPHRIPPTPDDESESEVEDNVDMLRDADTDKDIVRTKIFLYVSDLARKDRRILSKRYRLYHWNLITISIFYALPVIQLVITYQRVLNATGNEDICYYNFLCARPLGELSAFNNVFSNIGYGMLGILFLILVLRKDLLHKRAVAKHDKLEKHYGIPQHFGLFYAMGFALVMEGVLSGCYHVCPSYTNFQFDTSYMYMIAWLCMLKIYQTRHPDINATAHTAYFALSFVILVAVIGVVSGTTLFWILFMILDVMCTLVLSAQIYYMGRWRLDLGIFRRTFNLLRTDQYWCASPMYSDRMLLLFIVNIVNWSLAVYGVVTEPKDFASYLLSIFMVNLLMYFAFYIIMKLRSGEKILPIAMMYIVIATLTWGFASYFFIAKLTSWEHTPALSREGNKECILFDFYDDHDVWHFISAMALFFSFMILLNLDDDLILTPRDQIKVF